VVSLFRCRKVDKVQPKTTSIRVGCVSLCQTPLVGKRIAAAKAPEHGDPGIRMG
jgi:hypothetical protein